LYVAHKIQLTERTYYALMHANQGFHCTKRGQIDIKVHNTHFNIYVYILSAESFAFCTHFAQFCLYFILFYFCIDQDQLIHTGSLQINARHQRSVRAMTLSSLQAH